MKDHRTQVWKIDPHDPAPTLIEKVAQIIRAGGLVAFPTETVYGLGTNALDPKAVELIYRAKGRPPHNPLIVHVAGVDEARELATAWPKVAQILTERFWPGPLTLVLPRSSKVPEIIAAGGPTVAIRCPAHPVALALIRKAGVPIAAPSANRSSRLSPTCAEHVLNDLAGRIDLVLDGGPTTAGIESTVIDLSGDFPRLLRPGPISPTELEPLIGPVRMWLDPDATAALPSPGMFARHYAPRTKLECLGTLAEIQRRVEQFLPHDYRLGILSHEETSLKNERISTFVLPANPHGYAADLYRALHELDRKGLDRILVLMPPDTKEWLAVRDRLTRAATPSETGSGLTRPAACAG